MLVRFPLFRVVNYAGQITEAILRKLGFPHCARSRFRNSESRGDFAEIATSPNQIASIGRRSAFRKMVRVCRDGWRFFSVRVVNYAEKITEATLVMWKPA